MRITTKRLEIRPFKESDAQAMIRLLRNGEVAKTYMIPPLESDEAARPLFERFRTLSHDENRYVVGLFDGGNLVGFMNDVEREGSAIEMGYVISPEYWNQGYCTEALTAMIDTLFACGWETVFCGAFEENPASLRVMEKSGMVMIDRVDYIEYRGVKHRCLYRAISKHGA